MSNVLVEFDDLAALTAVSDQYASRGITFVVPPRGGSLPFVASLFGSRIIRVRGPQEIGWCEARARFDTPRRKLGVALMNLRDMPVKVTLSATDVAGHQVASTFVSMSPSTGATAFLELVQPIPEIRGFLVTSASIHDRWAIQWVVFDEAEAKAKAKAALKAEPAPDPDCGLRVATTMCTDAHRPVHGRADTPHVRWSASPDQGQASKEAAQKR
jgi:hypothetical protein